MVIFDLCDICDLFLGYAASWYKKHHALKHRKAEPCLKTWLDYEKFAEIVQGFWMLKVKMCHRKSYPIATWKMITCSFSASCEVNRAKMICLLPPAPKVTTANVSGGGGSRSELVITWEVSKLTQDPLTHGGGSQTSLFSADLGLCFINNSWMA